MFKVRRRKKKQFTKAINLELVANGSFEENSQDKNSINAISLKIKFEINSVSHSQQDIEV